MINLWGKMLILNLLVPFSLVSDNSGQEVTTLESPIDRIKDHLGADPTTNNILAEIYISLSNLLVSDEILASTKPEDSRGLKQAQEGKPGNAKPFGYWGKKRQV